MLTVDHLEFWRNQEAILPPQRLAVAAGQLLFVVGPNGSGKSTLLRLLAGLLNCPRSTHFAWHGQSFSPDRQNDGPGRIYLGHQLGLSGDLSAIENLQFSRRLTRHSGDVDAMNVLQMVGLVGYERSLVRKLSAGQRKRVALAQLLLKKADLWLLDEPYSNLDAEGVVLVDRLLAKHLREGGLAIVTSHGSYTPNLTGLVEYQLEQQG